LRQESNHLIPGDESSPSDFTPLTPFWNIETEAGWRLKAYLTARADVMIWDAAGPYVEAEPWLEFKQT